MLGELSKAEIEVPKIGTYFIKNVPNFGTSQMLELEL